MRIIAGKYRGRRLNSPQSLKTRPTSDRLRETLFNVLAPRIEGARFLDLCAGTGAVGIEGLSRGAQQVTFVERSRKMCALIEANLAAIEIDVEAFDVVTGEATEFLRRRARKEAPFDLIFFDPPYDADYDEVMQIVGSNVPALLAAEGAIIVEHAKQKELQPEFGALKRYRVLKQGDSVLSFYSRRAA